MNSLFVKTGDTVTVIAGKDKGKTGKVLQVFPKLNRVVVEGVNITKRHLKSRKQEEKGQAIEFPMPIHASNVKIASVAGEEKKAKAAPADKAEPKEGKEPKEKAPAKKAPKKAKA